ncbi:unnamed protein product [Amoebophrya sp. A25]|nr:unnamed protein product [Amoebophrya sp. A25]|eukprot:GSA25T00005907001.1
MVVPATASTSVGHSDIISEYGGVMQSPNLVYEDFLTVSKVDHSRFDKVGRITAASEEEDATKLEYDVYTEIFPLQSGDKLHVVMLKQLSVSDKLVHAFDHDPRVLGTSIADKFGYVTHGVCYDLANGKDGRTTIHLSFGGLLMRLTAQERTLKGISKDERVYFLVRKDN